MDFENDIFCMNLTHQAIIMSYLGEMQELMDKITLEDDNYEEFLVLLSSLIDIHNEQGLHAYKDMFIRQKWFFSLPNMIYWACLGYLCGIETEHLRVENVIKKMSKILIKTIKKLEKMALISPGFDNDETILN